MEGGGLQPGVRTHPPTGRFQLVLPPGTSIDGDNASVPLCLQLAGTGDHYFWKRRMFMGRPLAQEGIASLIIENPFYGARKPREQFGSSLLHVTDLFVLGAAISMESAVLLKWSVSCPLHVARLTQPSLTTYKLLGASSWASPSCASTGSPWVAL